MSACSNKRRAAGLAYPRTCSVCGLGPCRETSALNPPEPTTNTVKHTPLLPCPFCAGTDLEDGWFPAASKHFIFCRGCQTSGPAVRTSEGGGRSAWNERADSWQPAETAPRDGSEFIACNRGFAPFTCRFWQGGFVHYDFDEGVIRYGFELWQPLPAPAPQEKGGE